MGSPRPTPPAPPPSPVNGYFSSPLLPPTPVLPYAPLPPHTPSPYPSPPCSNSTIHPSPPYGTNSSSTHIRIFSLHPLLRYSQHGGPGLVWDLRGDPAHALLRQVTAPGSPSSPSTGPITNADLVQIPEHELLQPATAPPVSVFYLTCGIAPPSSTWGTITVTSTTTTMSSSPTFPTSSRTSTTDVVTVLDVLHALRKCMFTCLTQPEWDALPKKQQERVNAVFDERWRMSETPALTRGNGVLRQDCLLQHTIWAGLTLMEEENAAVLTLRRPGA
ncbi:hypothetical protein C0991_011080 [Blastosporella zonata]|nr:hypothetical protein C0991_011080 [Blastosporella zonata]